MPETQFETRDGFTLRGVGVEFGATEGLPGSARGMVAADPFAAACRAVSAQAAVDGELTAVELVATVTLTDLEVHPEGSRDAAVDGEPRLVITPPEGDGATRYLALIEEGDVARWVADDDGEIVVSATPSDDTGRGFFSSIARRVVRVIAVRVVGAAMAAGGTSLVEAWDRSRVAGDPERPLGGVLRRWTAADHRSPDAPEVVVAPAPDARPAPALLVIHGFMGSIHGSFTFADEVVTGLCRAYGELTMAYDHPTIVATPEENAADLLELLRAQVPRPVEIDILAHSRGGLVARHLAAMLETDDGPIRVRSITFVATPNAGTPLADDQRAEGLLDAVTAVAGRLGGEAVHLAVALAQDVLLKAVAPTLRGWMAMNPASPELRRLNDREPPRGVVLRAIAADYEPRTDAGLARRARDTAIDLYFGSVRNDLIVPTRSTIETDRAFRIDIGRRLVLDSSRGVDHGTFWTNRRVVDQLLRWFSPDPQEREILVPFDDADPLAAIAELPPGIGATAVDTVRALPAKARHGIEGLLGGPITTDAPISGDRPVVVVVPGIMGTHLARRSPTGPLVWIDSARLALGAFRELRLPADGEIVPAGINKVYLPLVSRLRVDNDVHCFGYDWRGSVVDAATRLATFIRDHIVEQAGGRPIHIVAHSMGGLVTRALGLTDAPGHEAGSLWGELHAGGGRIVMLGTPNRGSHVIPLVLTGEEMLVKALAAIDLRSRKEALARVIATFPGVYEMLPAHGSGIDEDLSDELYTAATWGTWSDGEARADQALLDKALDVQTRLATVPIAPGRVTVIAGSRVMTPFRLASHEGGRFSIGQHLTGDGRVSHALTRLDGAPTYFVEATHGGLPADRLVLEALGPILDGRQPDLPDAMAPLRAGAADTAEVVVDASEVDPEPALTRSVGPRSRARDAAIVAEGSRMLLGGGRPGAGGPRPVLRVSVVNASLEMATHPVAVGHYAGLPMGGAEGFLDGALDGLLRGRRAIGGYPEDAGSGRFYGAGPEAHPPGALVLGLGDYSTLSRGTLAAAMAEAVADLLAATCGHGSAVTSVGVSSVLVGTPGRRGLAIDEAVEALVQGTVAGLERYRQAEAGSVGVVELEIVERYTQTADEAARAVKALPDTLPRATRETVDLRIDSLVRTRAGHVPGAPAHGSSGPPWVKVITRKSEDTGPEDRIMRVEFSLPAHGAQSQAVMHPIERDLARAMVAAAVRSARPSALTSALFGQLLPRDLKLDLDQRESIHLVVDRELARVPWELLGGSGGSAEDSFALRAGFLRQLESVTPTRAEPTGPEESFALVIADPPTELPRLPGARREGTRVAALLRKRGYAVTEMVFGGQDAPDDRVQLDATTALHEQPWRVVHIAAHGVLDDDEWASGVVVGPTIEERLTALTFRNLDVTPDLVFLNCCHLGQLGAFGTEEASDPRLTQPNVLAASLAETLMGLGVKAVVVAGWAVDDGGALTFAETLYAALLDGHPLGEATRRARIATHSVDAASRTWGAYQVYGSPDFELLSDGAPSEAVGVVSVDDAVRQLHELTARAGTGATHDARLAERVEAIADAAAAATLAVPGRDGSLRGGTVPNGRLCAALGRARAEVHDLEGAIAAYHTALGTDVGSPDIVVAEQLANLRSRHGAHLRDREEHGWEGLFEEAQKGIDAVIALAGATTERASIRAGISKRRALAAGTRDERREWTTEAMKDYTASAELQPDPAKRLYPEINALQLAGLLAEPDDAAAQVEERRQRATTLLARAEEVARTASDYFDLAAPADALVARLLVEPEGAGATVTGLEVAAAYHRAFGRRSQERERRSSIDHVDSLILLADETHPGVAELRVLAGALTAWTPG